MSQSIVDWGMECVKNYTQTTADKPDWEGVFRSILNCIYLQGKVDGIRLGKEIENRPQEHSPICQMEYDKEPGKYTGD